MGFTDETVRFNLDDGSKDEISNTLTNVYRSLAEKGYNPINQIVGCSIFFHLRLSMFRLDSS